VTTLGTKAGRSVFSDQGRKRYNSRESTGREVKRKLEQSRKKRERASKRGDQKKTGVTHYFSARNKFKEGDSVLLTKGKEKKGGSTRGGRNDGTQKEYKTNA